MILLEQNIYITCPPKREQSWTGHALQLFLMYACWKIKKPKTAALVDEAEAE